MGLFWDSAEEAARKEQEKAQALANAAKATAKAKAEEAVAQAQTTLNTKHSQLVEQKSAVAGLNTAFEAASVAHEEAKAAVHAQQLRVLDIEAQLGTHNTSAMGIEASNITAKHQADRGRKGIERELTDARNRLSELQDDENTKQREKERAKLPLGNAQRYLNQLKTEVGIAKEALADKQTLLREMIHGAAAKFRVEEPATPSEEQVEAIKAEKAKARQMEIANMREQSRQDGDSALNNLQGVKAKLAEAKKFTPTEAAHKRVKEIRQMASDAKGVEQRENRENTIAKLNKLLSSRVSAQPKTQSPFNKVEELDGPTTAFSAPTTVLPMKVKSGVLSHVNPEFLDKLRRLHGGADQVNAKASATTATVARSYAEVAKAGHEKSQLATTVIKECNVVEELKQDKRFIARA